MKVKIKTVAGYECTKRVIVQSSTVSDFGREYNKALERGFKAFLSARPSQECPRRNLHCKRAQTARGRNFVRSRGLPYDFAVF
jgi:hypothetical protein